MASLAGMMQHPRMLWLVHLAVPVAGLLVLLSAIIVAEAAESDQRISTARCTEVPNLTNTGFGSGIAVGAGGAVYVLEAQARCVVRIDAQGNGAIVAGAPGPADCGACDVDLRHPFRLAVGPDGTLYLGQQEHAEVLVVEADGSTRTIQANYEDYVRPAVQAIAVDGSNALYVAEQYKVRRYPDDDDLPTVVAGRGDADLHNVTVVDSIGADDLALGRITAMALGPDGSIFLFQEDRYRILRIHPDRRVTRFAGTGKPGDDGDGGPATGARVDATAIAVDDAGNVYLSIQDSHRIRRVGLDGRITTIAGTGEPGPSGDGGPAVEARLNYPAALAFGAGALYVLDGGQVRRIDASGTIDSLRPH